jgi:putative PIN family toxin of toxin-antitoxin system
MRIVLDTNVLASALLSPQGIPAKILGLVLNKTVEIVYDNSVLVEYIDVLNRKKLNIHTDLINLVLDFIKSEGIYAVSEPQNIKFADEDDKLFYDLFKCEEIDYLVTGNIKHFPKEKNIVSPRGFIDRVIN